MTNSLHRSQPPRGEASGRPGRRERRRRETRERLFRAALRLFAERGFAATTVEDITQAADVGKGTLFNYFPSKEHIMAAFGEMQVGKVQAALEAAQTCREPIRAQLQCLVHRMAEEPGRSPALMRSLMFAIFSSETVREIIRGNLIRVRELLAELLVLGQRRGEIRGDVSPADLARVVQQSFFGTVVLWAIDPSSALTKRLDCPFPLLWSGIRAPARAHRGAGTRVLKGH